MALMMWLGMQSVVFKEYKKGLRTQPCRTPDRDGGGVGGACPNGLSGWFKCPRADLMDVYAY